MSMPPLTDRIAAALAVLCGLIARHGHLRRLSGPLVVLIWGQVRGIGAQIGAVLARMQAGQLRRYPARRSPRPPAVPRRPPGRRALPRGHAWLVALLPETAASAAQLQLLLAAPEIPDLLSAAPQLRRALRPLCRMLGVRLPPPPSAPPPGGPAPPVRPAATASPDPASPAPREGAADPAHGLPPPRPLQRDIRRCTPAGRATPPPRRFGKTCNAAAGQNGD